MTGTLLAAALVLAVPPAPASVWEPSQTEPPPFHLGYPAPLGPGVVSGPNPALAATLSAVTPLALFSAGVALMKQPAPITYGGIGVVALSPVGLGMGQCYAGEPLRGALVGLGGPVVALGLGVLGDQYLAKPGGMRPSNEAALMYGLGVLSYGAWACWDAYQTAERQRTH